jgi:hypothetical protein
MANNTDPGFAPSGPDQPSLDAPSAGGNFDTANTPPFGDPDQHLYGGTGTYSPAPLRADPAYEGRHRAVD